MLFAWQPTNFGGPTNAGGFYQEVTGMSFRILDPSGTEYLPATAVDTTLEANQLDDATSTGGLGRIIIPTFTIDTAQPTGRWTIEVTFEPVADDGTSFGTQTVTYTFRVLDEAHPFVENSYAQIQDMLDAGFPIGVPAPVGGFSFEQAEAALRKANAFIERVTSRRFYAWYGAHDHDGRGGPKLQFRHVVCGLTSLEWTNTSFNIVDRPAYSNEVRVYNRHLRQNMVEPDDRNDPRLEFLTDRAWSDNHYSRLFSHAHFYESNQNVKVHGMWGYTDYDGSPFGRTPLEITEVALRYAARVIQPLWTAIGGSGANIGPAGPLLEERTDMQTVVYSEAGIESSGAGAYVQGPACIRISVMPYRGRLLWPMVLHISRLDTASTESNTLGNADLVAGYDRIFREPVTDEEGNDSRVYMGPVAVCAQVNSSQKGYARKIKQLPGGRELQYNIRTVLHYQELETRGLLTPSGDCIFQPSDRLDAIYNKAGELLKDFSCNPLFICHVRDAGWGLSGLTRNLVEIYWSDRRHGAPDMGAMEKSR